MSSVVNTIQTEQLLVAIRELEHEFRMMHGALDYLEIGGLIQAVMSKAMKVTGRFPHNRGPCISKHIDSILSTWPSYAHQNSAVLQLFSALPSLAEVSLPVGCPAWVDLELVEETLKVFQPVYTERKMKLLSVQNAIDMVSSVAEVIECEV